MQKPRSGHTHTVRPSGVETYKARMYRQKCRQAGWQAGRLAGRQKSPQTCISVCVCVRAYACTYLPNLFLPIYLPLYLTVCPYVCPSFIRRTCIHIHAYVHTLSGQVASAKSSIARR